MELTLQNDQSVFAQSEGFLSWRLENELRERERHLEILERRIEEKNVLLRAKEAEMSVLEKKILTRIKDLIVEIDEKETRLAEIEDKARRLERQSRRHTLMGY